MKKKREGKKKKEEDEKEEQKETTSQISIQQGVKRRKQKTRKSAETKLANWKFFKVTMQGKA